MFILIFLVQTLENFSKSYHASQVTSIAFSSKPQWVYILNILVYVLACASLDLGVQKCTNVFWMGFTLANLFHFVSLEKCSFCNIYLESIYNSNQKYLKIYFLIIFLKQILNTFPKKIKLWPNISINICVNALKRCEDDYHCETDWPYLKNFTRNYVSVWTYHSRP